MATQTTEKPVQETMDATRHYVQEATNITRHNMEHNMNMGRRMADLWVATVEANLKAAFELQNAAMTAGRTLMGTTGYDNHTYYDQWTDMVRQAQRATMDAWNYGKRLSENFEPPK